MLLGRRRRHLHHLHSCSRHAALLAVPCSRRPALCHLRQAQQRLRQQQQHHHHARAAEEKQQLRQWEPVVVVVVMPFQLG